MIGMGVPELLILAALLVVLVGVPIAIVVSLVVVMNARKRSAAPRPGGPTPAA